MPQLRTIRVFLLAAILVAGAFAQSTGTVKGVMTDDSGAIIPTITVTLTGNGVAKTAQTQSDGGYSFTGLPPGQYHVKVALPGFAPVDQPVTVTPGGTLNVPVQLAVAA